ncbi:MAG: MFS transporter [Candidatus Omnitrophica bacterium]|nr:MFS transporter [Candidatus Omnitrophota bacterium]
MINTLFHHQHRSFLKLWIAQLISQFGDRIHQFALIALVHERFPGSSLALAKLMACTIMPVFLIQPFAGVFVDRWDRRTTLFVCDVVRGGLVLLIPFFLMSADSMWPIYGVVFLAFCFPRFHVPAKMAIIPDLVPEDSLLKANSLITTTGLIAAVLGAACGAFLIEYFGARNGFIIDSITFFVSALFVWNMAIPRQLKINKAQLQESVQKIKKSVWHEIREGFDYIIKHKEIRFVIDMLFVLFMAAGSIYVLIVVFVQEAFQSVTRDVGVLAIFLVVGLFVGIMIYGKWGKRFSWYKTIFFCLILGGTMLSVFALLVQEYNNLTMAMGLAFFWGLTIGPIFVASNTVVHIVSDEEKRGQVFSALEIVINFAFLVAMFISSWLSNFVPKFSILTVVGGLCAFVGLLGLTRSRDFQKLALDGGKMA